MTDSSDRQDEMPGDVTRRTFFRIAVGTVAAGWAAALGYPVYSYLSSAARRAAVEAAVKEVALPGADKLPAGSALMFKFAGKPAILIHHKDDSWIALSAVCTHLGCTVQFEADKNVIYCACHGGKYDPATGKNISGPPPKPLTKYATQVVEGKVVVSRA